MGRLFPTDEIACVRKLLGVNAKSRPNSEDTFRKCRVVRAAEWASADDNVEHNNLVLGNSAARHRLNSVADALPCARNTSPPTRGAKPLQDKASEYGWSSGAGEKVTPWFIVWRTEVRVGIERYDGGNGEYADDAQADD